jgi:nucleoside-triphosphate--adenylate kinase
VSTGDLLRKNIADGTDIGAKAKSFMAEGKLVPDSLVIDILNAELKTNKSHGVLLDGFPRTTEQAMMLKKTFHVDVVVSLNVPHEVIMDRMSQRWIHGPTGRTYSYDYSPPKVHGLDDVTGEKLIQREDDKPEVVKSRLVAYEKMTAPLLEFYQKESDVKVKQFTGKESDVIYPQVKKFLDEEVFTEDFQKAR